MAQNALRPPEVERRRGRRPETIHRPNGSEATLTAPGLLPISRAPEATTDSRRRCVLGLWDLRAGPVTLGGLVALVAELHAQCALHGGRIAGICFVGERAGYARLATSFQGVDTCFEARSLDDVVRAVPGMRTWPPVDARDESGRLLQAPGDTRWLQRHYAEHGGAPTVSLKRGPLLEALDLISNHARGALPIAVHLKNNPAEPGCTNADFGEMAAFFRRCAGTRDVVFVLVGNEPVDECIRAMPNVIVSQDLGSLLACDLALVQVCFGFMGMASGPCNVAVYGAAPYVIYKDPHHHAEQMQAELGEACRLSFASAAQRILRVHETADGLMAELDSMLAAQTRKQWLTRLAGACGRDDVHETWSTEND